MRRIVPGGWTSAKASQLPGKNFRFGSLVLADALFDPVAQHMPAQNVAFLNACSVIRRNAKCKICDTRCGATACSGEGYRRRAYILRSLQRTANIGTVTRRGDPNNHIARHAECFHLAPEDVFVAIVVADRSQD